MWLIRISIVVPYKNFIENAFDVFHQHNGSDVIYNELEYTLEEVVVSIEELRQVNICSDVIIARGLYAQTLKQYQNNTPIIELSLKPIDLLSTLKKCKEEFGNCKIGVIAAHNMLAGADDLSNLIDLRTKIYAIDNPGNENCLIEAAVSEGCSVVVGGLTSCRLAHKLGLKYMLIKTCRESLWQCITEAKRAAQISINEQEKSNLINIILNSSGEGILSVDMHKRIGVFNKSAEKILKVSNTNLKKLGIQDAPFTAELKKIILDDLEYSNKVINYNSSMLSVNKTIITINGSAISTVITFQEMSKIQDIEIEMRKKIHSRKHVAKATFEGIVGTSEAIIKTIEKAKKFSLTNSNILIMGESGTGKEMFAQSIHNYSLRKNGPFVAINCGAIPENLLESELFGYVGGAFTDAKKNGKPGYFELAHRGSLFLDEIGEIPMSLQSKLLRVLQEHEITKIGDDKITPVDVRIIAATNKNLKKLVIEGKFRQDLLYRIDVLQINIPALNGRREDIPMLIDMFLASNFSSMKITETAKKIMQQYEWRGNIRELFNICERLAVLNSTGTISSDDVKSELTDANIKEINKPAACLYKDVKEKGELIQALQSAKYNRTEAAKILGINRSTLWRKMKQYNL